MPQTRGSLQQKSVDPNREYLLWLRSLVDDGRDSSSFERFFIIAWSIPFVPGVAHDENRAADGIALRYQFEEETLIRLPPMTASAECTMIEFFIAVAMRANHIVYDWDEPNRVPKLFWEFMDNLGITNPSLSDSEIRRILERLIMREYEPDGTDGGMFPLKNPRINQQEVEIWSQLNAYLTENWL